MIVGFGWVCFLVSGTFVVGVTTGLLVWMGEKRTAEAVSCSAVCTNLQTASALSCGVWCVVLSTKAWSCGRMAVL